MQTYYDQLGVARDATIAEIRAAYRRMAQIHHPDHGGDSATMRALNAAWEILSQPDLRRQYDESLDWHSATSVEPAPITRNPVARRSYHRWKDRLAGGVPGLATVLYIYLLWGAYTEHSPWGWLFLGFITPEFFVGTLWAWMQFRELLGD